jgi:PAS domain S-box-containing protein/diguanylate cyclase (GGDEF)-like protein
MSPDQSGTIIHRISIKDDLILSYKNGAYMGIFSGGQIEFMNSKSIAILILLMFFQTSIFAVEVNEVLPVNNHPADTVLQLTTDEQKWLDGHRKIRIAYDGSLPPYSFVNDEGKIDGIALEIMSILSRRLGIDFTIYPNSDWTSIYKAAAKRKVDIIATMVKRPDRSEWFTFTKPYLTKSLVIVTQIGNNTISSRDDLRDKKIAVVKGYQYGEQVGNEFPSVKRVYVETMLDSLQEVGSRKVDAAILFLGTANYLQTKHHLDNLKVAAFYDRNSANESIAVRKDWPVLLEILQKGLDSLTEEEVQKIFAKWIIGDPQTNTSAASSVTQGAQASVESPPSEPAKTISPDNQSIVQEIEQKPAAYSVQKASPQTASPVKITEGNKLLIAGLLVAALFILWLFLLRKQRQLRHKSNNEMMTSVRNLQSTHNEVKHLTIENPLEISGEDLKSQLQEQTRSPNNEYIYYQHDCEGRFNYVSDSITRLLGYSESEFIENYRNFLTDNPLNRQIDAYTENCIKGYPNTPYEIEIFDNKGERRWLEVMDTPVYDGQGHCIGVDGVMHEIPARKTIEDVTDSAEESEIKVDLSDEQNSLIEHVRQAIKSANLNRQSFALIFLSLERLRMLDGSQVHFSKDEVLDEANKRLFATLRSTDRVINLDIGQFFLILPDTEIGAVSLIIDKIRKILQIPYLVGISSVVLDAKIGSAVYPGSHKDPEALIEEAKILMFSAESETTKAVVPKSDDYLQDENIRIQQDLVDALDECRVTLRSASSLNINALSRHSQFVVYYQSRHNANDYSINGFEALIRWRHPQFGLLLPKDFVGLVKEIGMLDILTYWIIQQVSFQALAWENLGIRPRVMSVNLEDLAVKQAVDVDKIVALIKETGAKPEWLEFSIPESEIANKPDLLIPIIKQFVDAGLVVAIDNFGSESALLSQLKTIPAQVIEIDPEFIRGLPGNTDDADIISYTVGILHELGKKVIVKEVENEQQLECLKNSGCDVIQGHLLSRPLPAKEAKQLIETLPDFIWFLRQ